MNFAFNPVHSDADGDVAIIGAGPYGLATAAHLRASHVAVRVFGEAMSFWRRNMPNGMKLRSPWIATHIADPLDRYKLDDYFREARLPLPDLLPVENFIDYGAWFQERVAPDLDTRAVLQVTPHDRGFRLALSDGENFIAKRVVVATGLRDHEYRPAQFDGLPRDLVCHSCEHTDSGRFRGRHVAVIGSGQSACEFGCSPAGGRRESGDHLSRKSRLERRSGQAQRIAQGRTFRAGECVDSPVTSRAVPIQLGGRGAWPHSPFIRAGSRPSERALPARYRDSVAAAAVAGCAGV